MNCYQNIGHASVSTKFDVEQGLDLNPYLNFLLDLNTLNLSSSHYHSPTELPESLAQPFKRPNQTAPPKSQACPTKPISTLSTTEITSRLDRLEIQLSKIVNNVLTDSAKRSSSHLRRCLSPVTTDPEENGSLDGDAYPRSKKTDSRKSKVPNGCGDIRQYRLLPPATFEDEEPEILPARVRSRVSKASNEARPSVSQKTLELEIKSEQERREDLEIKLSQSVEEVKKLKKLSESQELEAQAKEKQFSETLAEEAKRREKLERNTDVHKKLAAGLNSRLQASEEKVHELEETLSIKEAALTTLNCLQRENQNLKDEIRRLHTLASEKRPSCNAENEKDATKRSVDEAMKKATVKFTKFHKDEVRHFEAQIRTSQDVIHDLEEQLEAAATAKQREVSKLSTACSRMELDVAASKNREELHERRVSDQAERASRAEETARQKDVEIEKLQKTIAGLRKDCDRMKNSMVSLHSEKTSLRDLRDVVEEGEKKARNLEQENRTLNLKIANNEEAMKGLREKLSQLEDSSKMLQEKYLLDVRGKDEACEKLKNDFTSQAEAAKAKEKMVEELQETVQKFRWSLENTPKISGPSADTEHFKRRNRELEEVLQRLEDRKEELKCQLAATEAQLQESSQAHQIINAKWKEKSAYVARLQTNHASLQARFEMREEELTQERDEALERVQTLELKVEELSSRSRQSRLNDLQTLRTKYEQQLVKKDACAAKIEQQNRELEEKLKELKEELSSQKKQISGKFTRLGRFLQEFEHEF